MNQVSTKDPPSPTSSSRLVSEVVRLQQIILAWLLIEIATVYALLVTHPLHELRLLGSLGTSLVISVATTLALRSSFAQRRVRSADMKIAVACGIAVAMGCVADVMYGVYFNKRVKPFHIQAGKSDSTFSAVELQAALPMYQRDGLVLYKPNSSAGGVITGDLYNRCIRDSEKLASEVLELRRVDYEVDENGFRTASPLSEAKVIIGGDSFAFGAGVPNEDGICVQIQRLTGIPCYNSGFGGSGPEDGLLRIEYLLEQRQADIPLQAVLLLLFEGNDLEGGRNQVAPPSRLDLLSFTLLAGCVHSLEMIRQHSMLSRFFQNRLVIAPPISSEEDSPMRFDGVDLHIPLYHSEQHGSRLFYPPYLHTTRLDREAVRAHPGMARIRLTLRRLSELAAANGFQAIVAVAPTAARVHGHQFSGFPAIEADSPLNREVEEECSSLGIRFFDLVGAIADSHQDSLLYFRSDTHWNSAGHALAARTIAPTIEDACRASRSEK